MQLCSTHFAPYSHCSLSVFSGQSLSAPFPPMSAGAPGSMKRSQYEITPGFAPPPAQNDFQRPKRDYTAAMRAERFKTKLCKFFPIGKCSKGEACPYIHALEGGTTTMAPVYAAPQVSYQAPAVYGVASVQFPSAYDPYAVYKAPPAAHMAPGVVPAYGGHPQGGNPHGGHHHGAEAPIIHSAVPPNPYVVANAGDPSAVGAYVVPAGMLPATTMIPVGQVPQYVQAPSPRVMPGRFKVQQCKFFLDGKCSRGANCTYLHGEDDPAKGHAPPPGLAPSVAVGMSYPATILPAIYGPPKILVPVGTPGKYKIKPCKFFPLGQCTKGDACSYIHDSEVDGNPALSPNASLVGAAASTQ